MSFLQNFLLGVAATAALLAQVRTADIRQDIYALSQKVKAHVECAP